MCPFNGYPENKFICENVKNLFGFHPQDEDIFKMIKERAKYNKKLTFVNVINFIWFLTSGFFRQKSFENFKNQYKINFNLIDQVKRMNSSKEIFDYLTRNLTEKPAFFNHMKTTMASSMKSFMLKFYLEKYQDQLSPEDIDLNITSLIISGNEVVSVEPLRKIERIAQLIQDKEKFANLSDSEALKYLKSNDSEDSEAKNIFLSLLKEHGHRGYGEGDALRLQWRDNPISVIKSIQILLINKNKEDQQEKENKSIDEILSSNDKSFKKFILRLLLKYLLVPATRNGVKFREESRDLFMWELDQRRQSLWYLAQIMMKENFIPEKDLFFYLTCEEIDKMIINKNKLTGLIMKSRQRRKSFLKTDNYKFEQFCKGPDFKPINVCIQLRFNLILS